MPFTFQPEKKKVISLFQKSEIIQVFSSGVCVCVCVLLFFCFCFFSFLFSFVFNQGLWGRQGDSWNLEASPNNHRISISDLPPNYGQDDKREPWGFFGFGCWVLGFLSDNFENFSVLLQ